MTFIEQHKEFKKMLEELNLLRSHNKTFKEGDSQSNILLFSEALLTLTCLERFLRILPDVEPNAKNCLKKKCRIIFFVYR